MNLYLTLVETRVIGCLIEKEKTTPEQYPLSLNALVNACNQKSNRDPVLNLSETDVQDAIDELTKKHLVARASGHGSRVDKYQQRFAGTEFSEFRFNEKELSIIGVLFLRGPQTPGELRGRTNRLCSFSDIQEVEGALTQLMERDDGPFVIKLAREPGRRESRYAHLFSGKVDAASITDVEFAVDSLDDAQAAALEQRVSDLEQRLQQIESRLEQLEQ